MNSISDPFLALVSGRRHGAMADTLRALLGVASAFYLVAIAVRNFIYDHLRWPVKRAGRPVISVGNITTGGTGKTPVAAWIANHLQSGGRHVGILTRGYRGRPVEEAGDRADGGARQWVENDETMLLARLCPRATIIIEPDRVAGAERAIERGADALVLDDGFQHRRLGRDLDVVLVDATCPFGYGHLLPRGLLREPVVNLRRADVIILTRSDLVADDERQRLLDVLTQASRGRPILSSRHRITGFADLKGRPVETVDARDVQAVIFAGIGRFEAFRMAIERLGVTVAAAYEYPDHHYYRDDELAQLADLALQLDANALLTTEKDAVKLVGRWPEGAVPLLVAPLVVEFDEPGEQTLREALDRAVADRAARAGLAARTAGAAE